MVVIWCGGSRDEERKDAKGGASFYRVRFVRPPGLSPTTVKWAVTTPSTGLRVIRPGKEGGGDGCCLRTGQARRRAEFSNVVLPVALCRCGGGSGGGGVTYARVVAADNDDTQQWLLRVHTYTHTHIRIYMYTCVRMYTVYIMYKTESLLENS